MPTRRLHSNESAPGGPGGAPTFEIVVTENEQELGRHRLGPGEYYAGSVEGCTIRIPHGAATRNFAKISIGHNHRVMVEDLESSSGTMLDDLPIVAAGWAPGHPLRFGNVTLELWAVGKPRPPVSRSRALANRVKRLRSGSALRAHEISANQKAERAQASATTPLLAPAAPAPTKVMPKRTLPQRRTLVAVAAVGLVLLGFAGHRFAIRRHVDPPVPSAAAEAQSSFLRALRSIERGHFETANWHIEMAITNSPGEANYYFVKGNILESLHLWNRACAAYALALDREPGHSQALANLELCDEILKPGGTRLSAASRAKLVELMRSQRRESEARAMESP